MSLENSSCTLTYLSQCRLSCQDDFIGDDVTYLCNVTSDPGILDWVPIRGVHSVCEKGVFVLEKWIFNQKGLFQNTKIYENQTEVT